MEAMNLKHQLENNIKLYDSVSCVTGELASIWSQGIQEAEDLIKRKEEADKILITPEESMEIIDKGQKFYAKMKEESSIDEDDRLVAGEDIEANRFVYIGDDGKIYQSVPESEYLEGLKEKFSTKNYNSDSSEDKGCQDLKDLMVSVDGLRSIINNMQPRLTMQEIAMNEVLTMLGEHCTSVPPVDKLNLNNKVEHLKTELRR
jgi:hypothetical protein